MYFAGLIIYVCFQAVCLEMICSNPCLLVLACFLVEAGVQMLCLFLYHLMIAFLQRKSTVSFALVYSLTYFGSRFNSPKETRYRPLKQKMPSFIPQCSLFQGEPRLYSARECLARFTCLVFVCLWQFLICFKAFITFWYNTKNTITTCIFQRVITLLVQGTSGEENYSFSEFFTRFG